MGWSWGAPDGAEAGWEQGAMAASWSMPGLAPGSLSSSQQCGAVGVSLGQPSVRSPQPPHFEVVPKNAARSQTLSVWKEATSSDGARSRHGCVA